MANVPRLVLMLALVGVLAVPIVADARAKGRDSAGSSARSAHAVQAARRPGSGPRLRTARPPSAGRMGIGVGGRMGRQGARGFGAGRGMGAGRGRGGKGEAAPASVGCLRLRMNLPAAQVYIDGVLAGTVADFSGLTNHLELTPGSHQLEVGAPGYQSFQSTISVSADKTITERATLKKK